MRNKGAEMGELQDKVVLITGATRGIGKGIAEVCAREGARVIVSSIEQHLVEEVAASLPGSLERHSGLFLDVANPEHRTNAINFVIEKYGRLNGLVNNAGIDFRKPFLETSFQDWQKIMDVDLNSVFALSQLAIAQFIQQCGGGDCQHYFCPYYRDLFRFLPVCRCQRGG